MKTVVAIIHFDSLFPGSIAEIDSEYIEEKIRQILSHIMENDAAAEYVKIRLYGDWFEGLSLTKETSTLLQMLADVRLFPMICPPKKIVRGEILITRQLYGAYYSWDTFLSDTDNMEKIKYVDTMITCNMMSYSLDPEVSSLYLFSNELRHLPIIGIISKLSRKPRIELISSDEKKTNVINKIFKNHDVTAICLKL